MIGRGGDGIAAAGLGTAARRAVRGVRACLGRVCVYDALAAALWMGAPPRQAGSGRMRRFREIDLGKTAMWWRCRGACLRLCFGGSHEQVADRGGAGGGGLALAGGDVGAMRE